MPTAFQFGNETRLSGRTNCNLTNVETIVRAPRHSAVMPEERGMGKEGEETATETARHAPTSGAGKAQVVVLSWLMHGYALTKTTYIPADRKMETRAPKHWA